MNDHAPIAEFQLPREPYPGLRPFLCHESPLLFGRASQVEEVIERLSGSRFVAVIGGSGCGKSSLINAGVVPELRSFGIRAEGDFWVPLVCTPGTATGSGGNPATPITRLARKFAHLLKSRGSEPADRDRVDSIAMLLRQDAGFAQVIDTYTEQLNVAAGPKLEQARILFVIDQFEELFDVANADCADARLLVERVIDHFFNPHPRCFLVLTMRSEKLSDCAAYLKLPDAINESSYLMRRLDESELIEAIAAPAQRLLRLLRRQAMQAHDMARAGRLPAAVVFEPAVQQRLLQDVQAICSDPDHLPLLQHLLARIWEMACLRENVEAGMAPGTVAMIDLQRAVAAAYTDPPPLEAAVNVLRASVDNWGEAIFRLRSGPRQRQLEALLSRLAFKEPSTGTYSQRRVSVDDPSLFGLDGGNCDRAALWQLLEDPQQRRHGQFGFIGSVDYLFWDDEDTQRVTLKVSHESFIRGWKRFRGIIDKEADRFDFFVELLRRCERWSRGARSPRLLLERSDLDRLTEERLHTAVQDEASRQALFRALQRDHDGQRLAAYQDQIGPFLAMSLERQQALAERARAQEQERAEHLEYRRREREQKKLWRNTAIALALGIGPLLVVFLYFWLVQNPAMMSMREYGFAKLNAEQSKRAASADGGVAGNEKLRNLLKAAGHIEAAKAEAVKLDGFAALQRVGQWLPMGDARKLLAVSTAEPAVNGSLRGVLTTSLWRGQAGTAGMAAAGEQVAPVTRALSDCQVAGADGRVTPMAGKLVLDAGNQRGIFALSTESEVVLYASSNHGGCKAGVIMSSLPRYTLPRLLFDARLRYLLIATGEDSRMAIAAYALQWGTDPKTQAPAAHMQQITGTRQREALEAFQSELAAQAGERYPMKSVVSWRVPGGTAMQVAGEPWRLISESAQRVVHPGPDSQWARLEPARAGSRCADLAASLNKDRQPGFTSEVFQHDRYCFEIKRGNALQPEDPDNYSDSTVPEGEPGGKREEVMVAVYDEWAHAASADLEGRLPSPIASMQSFARLRRVALTWMVGTSGTYQGWIAVRFNNSEGRTVQNGAPWSTEALARLAREVSPELDAAPPAALRAARVEPRAAR